jgi:hypothetical protein
MQNLLSNRAMFKQLLARDILEILNMLNAGTCVDLATVREHLQTGKGDFSLLDYESKKFYEQNCTSKGYGYTRFDDRFYRAIQSINDTGYGITVRKDKQTGKLFAFSTSVLKLDNWAQLIADCFSTWTVNYNRGNK